MKYAFTFLIGAVFGASIALLFAPESGSELRSQIKTSASTGISKAQEEWQKGMVEVHNRVEKLSGDIQVLESKVKESIKPA